MTKTRLKELRKKYKYTQTDIANMLEISQTQYFKLENNFSNISYDKLHKLANFYETSIDYLLFRTDNYTPYPRRKKNPQDNS